MKTVWLIGLAGMLAVTTGWAQPEEEGTTTFRMDRLESVRDYYALYYGQRPPYRESGEEDFQDSIARCVLAYIKFKMRRLDTVILYAGRDPGDDTHLLCHVFPIDEGTHARMCRAVGMDYVGTEEAKYELRCKAEPMARVGALW
jgi:hypothetical protein